MSNEVVVRALRRQLEDWRTALDSGAQRVGWKIGLNIPEVQARLGLVEPVIGHLTSATLVASGDSFAAGDARALHAETEIAIEIGEDVAPGVDAGGAARAIAGYGAAIEIVDLDRPPDDLEAIVATNIFHRGVVLGPTRSSRPDGAVEARICVDGEERGSASSAADFAEVVRLTARLLAAAGENLRAGDRIITGSIVPPVPVGSGDRVTVELGALGGAEVRVA